MKNNWNNNEAKNFVKLYKQKNILYKKFRKKTQDERGKNIREFF